MIDTTGHCPLGTGSREPDPSVPALRASIPNAGDIGIVEDGLVHDGHRVVRVVKVGKVMWEIEEWRKGWKVIEGRWDSPSRRKVRVWLPLPPGADPQAAALAIDELSLKLRGEEREAQARYHAAVAVLASAIEARSGETEGLDAEGTKARAEGDAQTL